MKKLWIVPDGIRPENTLFVEEMCKWSKCIGDVSSVRNGPAFSKYLGFQRISSEANSGDIVMVVDGKPKSVDVVSKAVLVASNEQPGPRNGLPSSHM
jgi:hypothetical protein